MEGGRMLEQEATIIEMPAANEPLVHQIAKGVIVLLIGIATSKAVDKAYDAGLDKYRAWHNS
jgi:2-keto-3-deoxy-6-phosphogluconate aldolase